MRKSWLTAVAGLVLALGITGIASAGGPTFNTTIKFNRAVQDPADEDRFTFFGAVKSDHPKCENRRVLKFAVKRGGDFERAGKTETDGEGKWEKTLDLPGLPDVRITAPVKRFGPDNSKTCERDQILLTAN